MHSKTRVNRTKSATWWAMNFHVVSPVRPKFLAANRTTSSCQMMVSILRKTIERRDSYCALAPQILPMRVLRIPTAFPCLPCTLKDEIPSRWRSSPLGRA